MYIYFAAYIVKVKCEKMEENIFILLMFTAERRISQHHGYNQHHITCYLEADPTTSSYCLTAFLNTVCSK